jgi:hypothetical protein
MKRVLVLVVATVGLGGGCSKQAGTSHGKSDAKFDARWQAATAASEPVYIESDRGGGLMGEVRRAIDPPGGDAAIAAAIVKGPLPDSDVVSVIRRNLPAVKGCYQIEERAGTVGSGKAIVSLTIEKAGTVSDVAVDAPAFAASKLPACISARAKAWTFPKVTQGPKHFSYPFVFVGG